MTLDELRGYINTAAWFVHLGEFREREDAIPLGSVAASDSSDWLPTSPDQLDPIHGDSLVQAAQAMGLAQNRTTAELEAYKVVLQSMRGLPDRHPRLVDGPHDFTPAAKGGAAYAVRMAAREIIIGRSGFWCSLIPVYHQGNWPCGITRDKNRKVVL